MLERITIIPETGLVMINDRGFTGIDMSDIPENIHAIQWYDNYGFVEYKPYSGPGKNNEAVITKPDNKQITSLDDYQSVIEAWKALKEAEDNPPSLPDPTPEEIKMALTAAVQNHLDAKARERNYDGILSACSYVASQNPKFAAEAAACVAWRDAVWAECYELLDQVLTGQMTIPTPEALVAILPVMEWPS